MQSIHIKPIAVILFVVCTCFASAALAARPTSQFATIAPLPGDGVAINSNGRVDSRGAVQINIPVAYTPGSNYVSVGLYGGSHIGEFADGFPNGSAVVATGFGRWPRVYVSAMQISRRIFDSASAVSAQVQVVKGDAKLPALAFGVQDAFDTIQGDGAAKATYGVATKAVGDAHVTLGFGGGRFLNRFFGGVSCPLNKSFSLAVEYDGFQANEGLAWRPGGRSDITFIAGYNDQAGIFIGASAVGSAPW